MVGLRYDPPVLLLYGLDQVREHHRRKPQVVLGGFEALMTHVDGKVRKGCREISSLSHPFVQNTNSIGVSIMPSSAYSAACGEPDYAE